jgi:hypothetical protein
MPPNASVAPFSTLWRRDVRFSVVVSLILTIRCGSIGPHQ